MRADVMTTARLFWAHDKLKLNDIGTKDIDNYFSVYSTGFYKGYQLAEDKHKKDINDREQKIAQLMATIEELRG